MRSRFNAITLSRFDSRLRPTDLNVLDALCFFAKKPSGKCTADRKTIGLFAGIPDTRVSEHTTRLVKFGWIEKVGGGRAVEYFINWDFFPADTITESVTVLGLSMITEPVMVDGAPTGETVTKIVTDKGETVTEIVTDNIPTVTDSVTVRTERTVTDSGTVTPVSENREATICSNININNIINNNSDQIRSEQTDDVLCFHQAVMIMRKYHSPYTFKQTDTENPSVQIIQSWVDKGYSPELIDQAAREASQDPSRKSKLGPRYVDGRIESILSLASEPERHELVPHPHDHQGLQAYGARYGVLPGRGESWAEYHKRLCGHREKLIEGAA